MKIFKNRGDFYVPKNKYKKSREETILKILLAVIIVLTVVLLVLLNHKYNSAAEFFGEGEISTTQAVIDEKEFPKISGKTNFLVFETDDSKSAIHYISLIQADKNSKAYKVCALSPNMKIDKESLIEIYKKGGGASLQTKLTEYFGFEIDCFADFDNSSFIEFVSKMGDIIYNSSDNIKFNGGSENDKYSVHISEGEQSLNSKEISYLLRYYSNETKNYNLENELIISSLVQLFNEKNYEDCDRLFRMFIKSSSSNITVRDFENEKNALMYFCLKNTDITVYGAQCKYEKNVLTQQSVKEIKGYFNK